MVSIRPRRLAAALAFAGVAVTAGQTLAAQLDVPEVFPTITEAVTAAVDGDVIVVSPGVFAETVNPRGKAIVIRSLDPDDPGTVAQTVIDGGGSRALDFFSGERVNTVVEGFTITGGSAAEGGGIRAYVSDPLVRKCVIENNSATKGGGLYVYAASPWFDECVFRNNSATYGGAAYVYAGGYVRFDKCQFVDNTASEDGGAVVATFSDVRFDGSLIAGNSAGSRGGAWESDNSVARFISTVIRDNVAELGGALYLFDTAPRLQGSTVVRNVATDRGSAIFGIESQPLIRNTIVRDHGDDPFNGFGLNPTAEYSNVEGGLSGTGNIDADPLFIDPSMNDFRLAAGSPCIDTGFNGWVPSYGLRDLDGQTRIQGETVDIGAYEFEIAAPPAEDVSGSLVIAVRDEFSLAYGLDSPLLRYDENKGVWKPIVRNLPAYALAADSERQCFWVHLGENGLLGRVPYDTLELEEIAVMKYDGSRSIGLSGMAVCDGILYATAWLVGTQSDRLYTVDIETGTLSLVAEFPSAFEVWDLHYDEATDRLQVLSSSESIPAGPLGVYEVDPVSFELTEVFRYTGGEPPQLNALQGLAGDGSLTFLFRSNYNLIEIYDRQTEQLVDTISVPDSFPRPGAGWLWGSLTWAPQNLVTSSAPSMESVVSLVQQNVPNPFRLDTEIRFQVTADGPARLDVFDVAGRRVSTLLDERLTAGEHSVTWNGTDSVGRPLNNGVYFYRLESMAADGRMVTAERSLQLIR